MTARAPTPWSHDLPLALSQGDPSGIGPEIALMAWMRRTPGDRPFFVLGDPDHLRRVAASIGLNAPVAAVGPQDAAGAFAAALPVVPLANKVDGRPGAPSPADAAATIEAIERGVSLVREGRAHALVTNPISKDNLYKAGFKHPGHTEFLGELALRDYGVEARPVMLLWSPQLAVVPATIHVALSRVLSDLTEDLLVETGRIVARDLASRFGIAQPRLAFAGLNPHAGENGSMGREDIDIIAPAVARLAAEGVLARGPLPADTMFHAAARARYDVAICMYHDQALIPIKTLAFDSAVNVTLGLPFIRTSPDHGTAYDIAGSGKADPASLIAALHLAARLANADAGA
ncbi:MAG: 4-hydroxythreonine-4-phosphate dehydrogenase PdxA [Hyphomicrobiales bacterium]|nr:4-hydroxythreonine-4-phosphate dehydrogenase PdxA [Hyphomicrobiales bacterium]